MENNLFIKFVEIFVFHSIAVTVMGSTESVYALTAALLTRNTHKAKTQVWQEWKWLSRKHFNQ